MAVVGMTLVVAVLALVGAWAVASLARGLRRRRRLPPTRHARHVQLDLWG
jgi:hypothetical protein